MIAFDVHLYHSSAGGDQRLAWTIEYLPWPGLGDPERLRLVCDLVVDTVDFDHQGYDRQRWPTWREWEAATRSVPSRQVAVERLRLLGVTAMDDSSTDKERLVELYEARGDADTFARAKRLYEQALARAEAADPAVLLGYGYLLECHGRYSLREAVAQYERAIELNPDADKPHYQLILAYAALGEPERPVERYQQRLAQSPGEVREHRFLANAYLAARNYGETARVIDAGLALAPDDRLLLEIRGQVRAATGDPEGALADWRRAVDPDHNLGPVYLSAFLLERLGRLQEAAGAWRSIVDWCRSHDAPLTAEWPRQELERLRGRLSNGGAR